MVAVVLVMAGQVELWRGTSSCWAVSAAAVAKSLAAVEVVEASVLKT